MIDREVFAERRKRFAEAVGDGVAVIAANPESTYSNDVEYEYRPNSDLYYLTGFREPGAVLVIAPKHPEHQYVLFVRPRDPEQEVWWGYRAGPEGACEIYGAQMAFNIDDLETHLPRYLDGAEPVYFRLNHRRDMDTVVLGAIETLRRQARIGKTAPTTIVEPGNLLHEMRLIKSAGDLEIQREAARISAEAHRAAMAAARPGVHEYELEAIIEYLFRSQGAFGPGYPSIVGSGPNACVLHYIDNDRRIEDGDLVLIDAGAEYRMWNADITRTFPVSGSFTAEQREIYSLVLEVQERTIAANRVGTSIDEIHQDVVRWLTEGMIELGLLSGSVDEAIEQETFKRYYMHRTSHWLGVDVHDVGTYRHGDGPRPLKPGMVLTVEPGLYIGPKDEEAPERWRGIGVRIEDDILVTEDAPEVLTSGVPKAIDEVEALVGSAPSSRLS
jgi:Xaa-Pro aminopeptidase